MRTSVALSVSCALLLSACQEPPKPAGAINAKLSAPPRYLETGSRVPTDHPQISPDVGVMSQGALQDATGDHTGPGYNQDLSNPVPH